MFISLYTAVELDLRVPMILVVHVTVPRPMIFSLLSSSWPSLHCRQGSMEAVQKCRLILHVWLHIWIASRCENCFFCIILIIPWVWWVHLEESKTTLMLKTKTKSLVVFLYFQFLIFHFLSISLQKGHFLFFLIPHVNLFYECTLWDLWGKFLSMS